jgi:hypothetical protein
MSQFGMQMPGGRARRMASMDVYTGLLFCAVLALGVACGFVYKAAVRAAPGGGSPFQLHDKPRPDQSLKLGQ